MTEQNELLEAALKLAETLKSIENKADWSMEAQQALDAIEKHRPKPELVECWVYLGSESWTAYYSRESAIFNSNKHHNATAVHLREVTPAPEWERWNREIVSTHYGKAGTLQDIADAHNLEMKRVTGTEGK